MTGDVFVKLGGTSPVRLMEHTHKEGKFTKGKEVATLGWEYDFDAMEVKDNEMTLGQ